MMQQHKKSANHLNIAYNQMVEEMRSILKRKDKAAAPLQEIIHLAESQVISFGEINAEEAHEIAECIKRDINDAAEYMMETSTELHDWLALDIAAIERKVIRLFLSAAKRSHIALERFRSVKSIEAK